VYRSRLVGSGVDPAELDGIDADAQRDVDEATRAARDAAPSDPDRLLTNLWADGGAAWRN
jgi:pyruvate dehydrogenase E1 component alpha subunit